MSHQSDNELFYDVAYKMDNPTTIYGATNEIVRIDFSSVLVDIDLIFGLVTTTIPFGSTASEMQALMELNLNIKSGGISVTDQGSGMFDFEFIGKLGLQELPYSISSPQLTTEISSIQQGGQGTPFIHNSDNAGASIIQVFVDDENYTNKPFININKSGNTISVVKTTAGDITATSSIKVIEWGKFI